MDRGPLGADVARLSGAQGRLLQRMQEGGTVRVYDRRRTPVTIEEGGKEKGVSRASLGALERAGLVEEVDSGRVRKRPAAEEAEGYRLAQLTAEGHAWRPDRAPRQLSAGARELRQAREPGAAAALGRAGGKRTSEAKRRAAQANGKKGGRRRAV